MNKRTIYYTSAVAAPLLALGLVAAPAFAHGMGGARPELTDEQKTALEQVRELHKQGKRDEAHALLESAGLPARPLMIKFHSRMGGDEKMREQHGAVFEAIQNGDFATFQELTKDAPFAGEMDEATFAKLAEAHKLREAGDTEGAKAILDEAGLKPLHLKKGPGMRFHKGFRMAQ
jgi:hypothetical protein